MALPAKTPSDLAEGAKTRYDDWIVTHINQTLKIHGTVSTCILVSSKSQGHEILQREPFSRVSSQTRSQSLTSIQANFLGWHRWFIYEFEQSLKNDCNYTGTIPYWDWSKTAETGLENSPLFDGSATSLSGNGARVNYTDSDVVVLNANSTGAVVLGHGTGGGCVTSGPFANITVNLGPDGLVQINGVTNSSSYPYNYNPRCLRRDLTDESNQRFANLSSVLTLLRDQPDIWEFETVMQGAEGVPELGVHGGGHYALGGDPGRDVFVSPGDPAFWSHHAMIDRTWWLWQMQSPDERAADVAGAVSGPVTFYDEYEPHVNGTVDDLQQLGYVAQGAEVPLGELLSTTEGMFCYVYE